MTSALPAAETIDLHKRYAGRAGEVHALRGVSLRVERGEIFALLGPNGAGKTTWISIVCGLVRATEGRALVFGHDIHGDALEARRHIGLVPQEVNFDPFFTAREVLRFQMGYYGLRPDDARIDDVLGALGLADKAEVNTRELSGGMRRRLLIAKALVHRPRIAFLDEPTAGVDVALRRDLWAYVKRLRDEGTTIVLTTHYLEEAEALADRVAVIDHGRLVTLDSPAQLIARHGRARVRFTFAAPIDAVPPSLAAFDAVLDNKSSVVCPIPEGGPAPILSAAAALPTPIAELRTEQPTLEQVFLELTGGRA